MNTFETMVLGRLDQIVGLLMELRDISRENQETIQYNASRPPEDILSSLRQMREDPDLMSQLEKAKENMVKLKEALEGAAPEGNRKEVSSEFSSKIQQLEDLGKALNPVKKLHPEEGDHEEVIRDAAFKGIVSAANDLKESLDLGLPKTYQDLEQEAMEQKKAEDGE